MKPSQAELDAGLEREIDTATRAMTQAFTSGDHDGAREFAAIQRRLINLRSEEQKVRMEQERGLRAS